MANCGVKEMPGIAVKTFGETEANLVSGSHWQGADYLLRSVLPTKGIDTIRANVAKAHTHTHTQTWPGRDAE